MKGITVIILVLLLSGLLYAADEDIDKLIDMSEDTNQKVTTLYDQYKNDPLNGKTWGFEINPVRLIGQTDNNKTFAGSFSYFGKPMMELNFPYYYYSHRYKLEEYNSGTGYQEHVGYDNLFYADARVRMFTGNTSNGFFMSGFVRYATLYTTYHKDYEYDEWYWDDDEYYEGMESRREHKLGLGFGIGWRSFSYRGFYWAFSLSAGRYFVGDNEILHDDHITTLFFFEEVTNDNDMFYDIEILKFGFAF